MSEYTYTAVFAPDEDGGFVVTCPALPGLVTHGDTLEEARAMAAEAIGLYLESVLADGERLPISEENIPGTSRESVTVTRSIRSWMPTKSRTSMSFGIPR